MDVYIGIDPGSKGYVCALEPGSKSVEFIQNTAKPQHIFKLISSLNKHEDYYLNMVMIEDVHSIFGTSSKSNFNFGFNVGLLHGIVGSVGCGMDTVQPKVWQKYIGIVPPVRKKGAPKIKASVRSNKLKQEIAAICERLYPEVNIRGPKGGLLDGKSDALMIAHYCSHIYR